MRSVGVTPGPDSVGVLKYDWIPGVDLSTYPQQLLPSAAVDLATMLARVLRTLRDRDVVHRDIKPDNIVMQPDGEFKLIDFGLARIQGNATAYAGSGDHTAPEARRDPPRWSYESDLYSAASTLRFVRRVGADAEFDVLLGEMMHDDPTRRPDLAIVTRRFESIRARLGVDAVRSDTKAKFVAFFGMTAQSRWLDSALKIGANGAASTAIGLHPRLETLTAISFVLDEIFSSYCLDNRARLSLPSNLYPHHLSRSAQSPDVFQKLGIRLDENAVIVGKLRHAVAHPSRADDFIPAVKAIAGRKGTTVETAVIHVAQALQGWTGAVGLADAMKFWLHLSSPAS